MQKLILLFCLLSGLCLGAAEPETPPSPWALPAAWPRHAQLRRQLIDSLQRGDAAAMETVCREALKVLPGDATWHYNLACALAHRDAPGLALTELEKAITFGFRNADAIAQDSDFAELRALPRFDELLAKARTLAGRPLTDRPNPTNLVATTGLPFTLTETNVVFNFDLGLYEALLKLNPPRTALPALATRYSASKPTAPERPYVSAWLSEGSAAGNAGDVYLNRDRLHSNLVASDFPQLSVARYAPDSQPYGVDVNHPNALFPNVAVFGNISRGITRGLYWRSMARATFTEANLATRMDMLYLNNQFWALPAVNDYGKSELGDVFPANAPFQLVSKGISWSDQPFLRAALAASASFLRPTKQALLRRHLMGPTLQWLLRRTQKGVLTEADYFSAKAHPTAFDAARLDTARLVQTAHALQPQQIPPAVKLTLVNSKLFPVHYPLPLQDYPDPSGELLFATPSALSFILRAPAGDRTFLIHADPLPEKDPTAVFTWRVVHGDPAAVKIARPLGEMTQSPESGFAQITLNRRALTNRLDVACFARSHGTDFGAPAIISFYPLPHERRTYRADGQIDSIDYSNPDQIYCDPALALPRAWKDVYTYDAAAKPTGFTRYVGTRLAAAFTPAGDRIVARDASGKPTRAVRVKYTARETGNPMRPLELTYTDDGEPFDVK